MWQLNQKIVKDVKVVLDDIGGVCPRCYLRCAGVKNSKLIQEAGEIKEDEGDEPASKIAKTLPCRLCIGLLEERYMESAFQSVSSALILQHFFRQIKVINSYEAYNRNIFTFFSLQNISFISSNQSC